LYVLPYGQMSLWGYYFSLKWLRYKLNLLKLYKKFSLYYIIPLNYNIGNKYKGWQRIGPHNYDILSILFGSLLGDAHAERRISGVGTRITFYQEGNHVEYINWLHNLISSRGYCSESIPKTSNRIIKGGKVRTIVRFRTWTYTSFNWIHDVWYVDGIKRIPSCIDIYLTPLALAIWIMDDGSKVSQGLKLCTNSYTYSECLYLIKVLNDKFKLKTSVQSAGVKNQYIIYIWKESMPLLREIVNPYIIPEMKYKII
jgi:ubiquinol-cytochrome c reductase cytochrome b subunit